MKRSRMRVLIYTTIFPSRRAPVRGIYNFYIARELARHAQVRVVSPVAWLQRLNTPVEFLRHVTDCSEGLVVHYPTFWPLSRIAPKANPHIMELATRGTIDRVRREFPFDVMLAIWGYPDAAAALRIARRLECPLVTNLLGTDANDLASRPELKAMIAETLRASNSVVALSHAMAERIAALCISSDRIKVQYNGVSHEQFFVRDRTRCRLDLGLPLDRPIVLYVGNLEKVKGPDILIDAFARLVEDTRSKPLLAFAGAGSIMPSLQKSVRQRGLDDQVRWVGRRSHNEIPVWLGAADLLCLPSRMEGCPNVVIEAFASGRPVVGTAVGGVPELIEHNRGILVPPEDPAKLATGLAEALERDWDAETISRSVAGFTWEAFGQNLARMLETAVAEGPLWVLS
jgi:glycosyltransferase involved in cell wall biosynthesis